MTHRQDGYLAGKRDGMLRAVEIALSCEGRISSGPGLDRSGEFERGADDMAVTITQTIRTEANAPAETEHPLARMVALDEEMGLLDQDDPIPLSPNAERRLSGEDEVDLEQLAGIFERAEIWTPDTDTTRMNGPAVARLLRAALTSRQTLTAKLAEVEAQRKHAVDCYNSWRRSYFAAEAALAQAQGALEPFALVSSEGVIPADSVGHVTITTCGEYFHRAAQALAQSQGAASKGAEG